jgi:hypothetical protein
VEFDAEIYTKDCRADLIFIRVEAVWGLTPTFHEIIV